MIQDKRNLTDFDSLTDQYVLLYLPLGCCPFLFGLPAAILVEDVGGRVFVWPRGYGSRFFTKFTDIAYCSKRILFYFSPE